MSQSDTYFVSNSNMPKCTAGHCTSVKTRLAALSSPGACNLTVFKTLSRVALTFNCSLRLSIAKQAHRVGFRERWETMTAAHGRA